jgi:hypothetical protein
VSRAEQAQWTATNWSSGYMPHRAWTDAVEALGILVMQDGSMSVTQFPQSSSIAPTIPGHGRSASSTSSRTCSLGSTVSPSRKAGGGNYYYATIGQLGPVFIRLVFSALDSQAPTYPTASGLLGNVKVSNFDSLRDFVSRRAEES